MSEIVSINNSLFEFDLHLLNLNGTGDCTIPISKGMVRYMEIEDTLSNFGTNIKVRLTNFYGFLQKYKILDVTSCSNSFSISIKNRDYDRFPIDAINELQMLFVINKNTELSKNIIDRDFIFSGDEYQVHALKTQRFLKSSAQSLQRDPSSVGVFTSVSKTVEGCISFSDNGAGKERISKFEHTTDSPPDNAFSNNGDSLYDVISKCYPYIYYDVGGPGVLNLISIKENNSITRKFQLQPLGSLTSGLFQRVNSNNNDLSDFLLEKFTVSNSFNNQVLGSNFITDYDIIRQDQTDLLEKKWGDYELKGLNSGTSTTFAAKYVDLVNEFRTQILGNNAISNLPELNDDRKLFIINQEIADKQLSIKKIKHILLKSFIYDNVAISFKVRGQLYRSPGKFVEIITEESTQDKDDLNGYWFIVSVRHIFDGDDYYNELICVKFNKNGKFTLPITPSTPQTQPLNNIQQLPQTEEFDVTPDLPVIEEGSIIDGGVLPPRNDLPVEQPDSPVVPPPVEPIPFT